MLNAINATLSSPPGPQEKIDNDPFTFLDLSDDRKAECRIALRRSCHDLMKAWPEERRQKYQAVLTLLLDGPEAAATAIENVLARYPLDDSLRLLHLSGLLRSSNREGNALLAATRSIEFSEGSSALQLVRHWLFADSSYEDVRSTVELIINLRQTDKANAGRIFQRLNPPVMSIWSRLIGRFHRRDQDDQSPGLMPLFDPWADDYFDRAPDKPTDDSSSQALQEWQQERSDLHRRWCEVLAAIPEYREVALVALCQQNRVEGLPAPVDAWATALAIHSNPDYKAENGKIVQRTSDGLFVEIPTGDEKVLHPDGRLHDLPENADFLLWLARSSGHQDDLIKRLIPTLRRNGRNAFADRIDSMRGCYFAEGDNFAAALVAVSNAFLAKVVNLDELPLQSDLLHKAFSLGLERDEIDAVARALSHLVVGWSRPGGAESAEVQQFRLAEPGIMDKFCHEFLSSARRKLSDQQFAALVGPVLEELAGPVDARDTLLARAAATREGSPQLRTVERLIHLGHLVTQFEHVPSTLYFQTWEVFNQVGQWPEPVGNMRPLPDFDRLTDASFLQEEETVEFLIQRPAFLGSTEQFNCMPSSFGPDKPISSAFELVIERMQIDAKTHSRYRAWLEESAGDEFGARLARALLSAPGESPDPPQLESLLDQLNQLGADQQNALAEMMHRKIESPRLSRDLLNWLSKRNQSAWKARFDKWQQACSKRTFEQAPSVEIAALLLDAVEYNRFDDALEAWKWFNYWALREGRGSRSGPRHHLREGLSQLEQQMDVDNGTAYGCNLVLIALLIHHHDVSPFLSGRNPFPSPRAPWSALADRAAFRSNDAGPVSAESLFRNSIEEIGELAAERDIQNLLALMIANDPDWPLFSESVRLGASTEGPAQWLWKKLDLLLPSTDMPIDLDHRGMIRLFDSEASLRERAFTLQSIGQMVQWQTGYRQLREAPARHVDSDPPAFPLAFLHGEDPTAVVKTMLEVLREPKAGDWLSISREHAWIRLILFEIFSPLPEPTDPESQEQAFLLKKFRNAMLNFAERHASSGAEKWLHQERGRARSLTIEWQVSFATLLLNGDYAAAQKMWQKLRVLQEADDENPRWPDNDILAFISPLHSTEGKRLDLPEKLEDFASFWAAQATPAEAAAQ